MASSDATTRDFFRRHKHWWVVALVVSLIAGIVALFVSGNTLKSEVRESGQSSCEGANNSYVRIYATIIAVDTDQLVATMRLDFAPTGNLTVMPTQQQMNSGRYPQNASTLTNSLTLTTTGLLAQTSGSSFSGSPTSSQQVASGASSYTSASSSYVFNKGDYMQDLDVVLPLRGGTLDSPRFSGETTARYPEDSYISTQPFSLQIENGVGVGGPYASSCVELTATLGGWSMVPTRYGVNNAFDVTLSRSSPVKWYAYFVMGLMWALAIGGVAMAVIMLLRKQDEIDTAAFAYLAALLFAFPLIRQTLPGNPGPGSYVDLYSYYWTEVIVAITLVVLLARWITLKGGHDRLGAGSDEEDEKAEDAVTVDPGG